MALDAFGESDRAFAWQDIPTIRVSPPSPLGGGGALRRLPPTRDGSGGGDDRCGALQGVVTMTWRDQGWGNQKGMVSVVETLPSDPTEGGPGTPSDTPEARRDHKPSGMPWGPCVVAGREPAPHADETLRLSFPIKRGATYALWYRVGGGGGHRLRVRYCQLHLVEHCLRDPSRKVI